MFIAADSGTCPRRFNAIARSEVVNNLLSVQSNLSTNPLTDRATIQHSCNKMDRMRQTFL